ncbi:carbon-nitrogen hydrolase [Amylostereum chailletii]|nr:carbon-nitrogen hydrolase [Amylostereum chailletii]
MSSPLSDTPTRCHSRIAVLQFAPKIGEVEHNIQKAREHCLNILPNSIDLLCLPEMIFTGYAFSGSSEIAPFLEQPRLGQTSLFCAEIARKLCCYVTAGYPERLKPHELVEGKDDTGAVVECIGANTAVVYGPGGEWVGETRKTNLFRTDLTWAKPGSGFTTFHLPPPLGRVTVGICNDLNPAAASSSFDGGSYEIADYCLKTNTDILVLLNAWLDSEGDEGSDEDWPTLNYWATRLRPLWMTSESDANSSGTKTFASPPLPHQTIAVVCNRNGQEKDMKFAGSSAIFRFDREAGRPLLLDAMTREDEGVKIWTIK